MNILIIGYYFKNNLGDDLFIDAFKKILPNFTLTFKNSDKIKDIINFNIYDSIIFGGGDLINDYFYNIIKNVRSVYDKPIYGYGLGIPYRELIQRNYLNNFDNLFVRNKEYLLDIQQVIGSKYTHYQPDMVFKNFISYKDDIDLNNRKTIGIFLACSLNVPIIIEKLYDILNNILKETDYILHFICFDTGKSIDNNDYSINSLISDKLNLFNKRIINDKNRYSGNEMYDIIKTFRLCICSRFHSHILSTIAGIPFLGFHYANKTKLYVTENNYEYYCDIENTNDCKAKDFDSDKFKILFDKLNNNLLTTRKKLLNITKENQYILDNNLLENLIKLKERRKIIPNNIFIDNVDLIYKKYKDLLENKYDCKLENVNKYMSVLESEIYAKRILFEITNEISSNYIGGMASNIMKQPHLLRDMICWVWKDKREKILKIPFINMNLTSTHNFCGIHRSGWQYAIESINALNSNYGPIMDVYCDATFGWCRENPCREFGLIPYTQLWTGIFHHTPNSKYSENNIDFSTKSKEFIQSLPTCLGLFTLSEWLAQWLRLRLNEYGYPNIEVVSLYHPTSLLIDQFNPNILNDEKINIINIGAWLRNTFSIYNVKFSNKFNKIRLIGKSMNNYIPPDHIRLYKKDIENNDTENTFMFCLNNYLLNKEFLWKELGYKSINDVPNTFDSDDHNDLYGYQIYTHIMNQINSVKIIDFLEDKEYDQLLSKNVCFLDLIECSAANTLIECIARCNPIIVNKIPPVVEYIGEDYPLLYNNLEELETLVTVDKIREAYNYLINSNIKNKISSEHFYNSIIKSNIMKKCSLIQ